RRRSRGMRYYYARSGRGAYGYDDDDDDDDYYYEEEDEDVGREGGNGVEEVFVDEIWLE
ncbi:hypothetical protein HK104_008377, partial [Borealophlyctis nickersoniae]